jgi:hypothetical protein
LYNKYLVIITAENKEKYISDTIESCFNQNNTRRLRIIVIYSELKNEKYLKKKFKNKKKIIFLKSSLKKKLSMHDQLYKIEKGNEFAKNEWVLLLDGDDLFKKNKIQSLNNLNLNNKRVYLNNHLILSRGLLTNSTKTKKYKKWKLYKILFNDWPEKINTSSIIIHTKLLKKFYKLNKPYKWKYLAIDSQLILFAHYSKCLTIIKKNLTIKREDINNIDKKFSNYLTKIYWLRRYEQHNLTRQISSKSNFLDRIITIIFMKIFK